MKRVLLLIFYLLFFVYWNDSYAQKLNKGISLTPQGGFLLHHRSTMDHLSRGHSYGAKLGMIIQTDGSKHWHQDFNFPKIELKSFYYDFGNPDILGRTFGVSGGLYLPYFKTKGWSVGNVLDLGIAWITKHYNVISNPKNNVIGSHLNALVNLGFRIEKQWNQNAILFEVSMAHLSNGAYKLPNLGLNLPFIGMGYTYYFEPLHYEKIPKDERNGRALKSWSFYSQLIASVKQIYPTGGSTYGVAALINYTQYKAGQKCILEMGMDAVYNQSIIKYNKEGHSREKNIQLGVYGAYVLPIHKIQLFVAMGRYVVNPLDPGGMWFHKLGGRFEITDRLSGIFSIKSHWAKADYFEYGLSYRWK